MTSFVTGSPKWICFINGLEVPIIAASTTTQAGQLATAQITMPYSPFLSKLPKHTKITLFSFDLSKQLEPKLELDGTIQGVSWRKDKTNGNTGLFVLAQTDGIIWSERKKFNFYIDNGFGLAQLFKTTQDYESYATISENAISDPLSNILQSNNNDAGEVASLFLTHIFNKNGKSFDGTFNYLDCGYQLKKKNTKIDDAADLNLHNYSNYINKFYKTFQVMRKLCRIPIPQIWKTAFDTQHDWNIINRTIKPLEGEVNFWNYVTYICNHFNFEIYDIPDSLIMTLNKEDITYINNNKNANNIGNSILAEYLIKPKSPFGPIPYCNIVFPDQVLDKSFYKNYQNETTRCYSTVWVMPGATNQQTAGLVHKGITAPYFTKANNSYFDSFSVKNPNFSADQSDTAFLTRSAYEEEFGVLSKPVELPDLLSRLLTSQSVSNIGPGAKSASSTLQEMVNHEFFIAYTDKVAFTLQVTSDVDIVPGMSILVLDENDDHILAYCDGREKIWDKNGQKVINLKIKYPRHYTLEVGFANHYMNTFDPVYYPTTYKKDVSILEQYVGCKTIDQTIPIATTIINLMTEWNKYNKDTAFTKLQDVNFNKAYTKYSDYLTFMGYSGQQYDTNKQYNKMPEALIKALDISEAAASMQALQYSYAENGYLNPQVTTPGQTYPNYQDLNMPGQIQVNPYVAGIVNCHNRYLMQIGNNIT